jgi:flagellar protein FliO/FliZ
MFSSPLLQQASGVLGYDGLSTDLLRSLLALGGVCILLWLVARWFAGRRFGPATRYDAAVRVLRRIPLERRKHLYLVRVADRILLIGTGDGGPPSLIADVDPEMLERVSQARVNDTYG